jgi:Icc-related predicted phosphoesterase
LYTKALLTDEDIYAFNPREGATYFGKDNDGNLLICYGRKHSNYEGFIYIAELLIDKDTEKLTYNESFRADFGIIDYVFYCSGYSINGEEFGYDYKIPAAEFETAYREFYDAINFDVYWICGDILYHGAKETEYKGKIAYEKYLELTKKQEYLTEKSNYDDTKILIDDINSDGTDDIIYINNYSSTFAYYKNGEIKEIRAEANWGGELEGGGAPLYFNKRTDKFLTESTASSYKNYSFYEFSDGVYKLQYEYIWRELIVPWKVDKWADFPNIERFLEEENLTFDDLSKLEDEGELLGIAWSLGTFDRVNYYTIDDKEVTETDWQKAIEDFINDEDTILLCPDNTDLVFVDSVHDLTVR